MPSPIACWRCVPSLTRLSDAALGHPHAHCNSRAQHERGHAHGNVPQRSRIHSQERRTEATLEEEELTMSPLQQDHRLHARLQASNELHSRPHRSRSGRRLHDRCTEACTQSMQLTQRQETPHRTRHTATRATNKPPMVTGKPRSPTSHRGAPNTPPPTRCVARGIGAFPSPHPPRSTSRMSGVPGRIIEKQKPRDCANNPGP